MQQRETTTNRLADIIRVIQIGHRTGTLTVERGENAMFEEGMIVFAYGQMTQAVVGSRTGGEAFTWLNHWGSCRFRFITSSASATTLPTSSNGNYHLPVTSPGVSHRTQRVDNALSRMEYMGLSRVHRHLFLLIDGRRTVVDLARLMGRRLEEVQKLLDELERANLI